MKYRCTLWRFKFTLGARDFSSAVSGFCQVFGQHLNFPPHARKTSGTQGSSNLLQNTSLPLRLPKYSKCYNKSSNGKKTRVSVNMSNLSSSACFLLRSKLRPSEVKIKIFRYWLQVPLSYPPLRRPRGLGASLSTRMGKPANRLVIAFKLKSVIINYVGMVILNSRIHNVTVTVLNQ